ncbi:MAG TPA: AsmA family protein, partial [Terriglobia bacterium]|nr:AsmA family protein [Terriglobia bacterium]
MRNKVVIGLGVLAILVVIAVFAAPAFVDVNRYRPQIEAELRNRLGREVSLGPMKISLIPLAFRVENAVIAEDPIFNTGRPFAQVQTLFVSPEWLPLLHREVQIKSLQLDGPAVELVRNEQGAWNFSTLMTGKQESEKSGSFSLDRLHIYDGQIGITDRQQKKPRAVYDHIDLLVSDFAPEKPFSVDLRAHMPGAGQQVVVLQGKIGPIQHDALARTAFDGKLNLDGVSLSGLQRFVKVEALENSDAVLTGDADVKNIDGALASTGKFEMRNSRIRGVDIGYPIAVDYEISSNINESTAAIQRANLKLGQTPVSLKGNIDAKSTPAQIDMTVQASNASIAEAARLAAAFGAAFNATNNVTGNLNLNLHGQGAVTRPVLSGQV